MKSYCYPPRKVLVPTDLGPASDMALAYAQHLHQAHGTAVQVLHAEHFELPPYFSSGQLDTLRRELKRSARAAVDFVRKSSEAVLGFAPEVSVIEGTPVETILNASEADKIDLLVLGTHGRHGAERLWLGSVTERVIRSSRIPVLAVRKSPTQIQEILCPFNLTEVGQEALDYAAEIARVSDAHLTVMHVLEEGSKAPECPLIGDEIRQKCRLEEVTGHGSPTRKILEMARKLNPDLIVMGAERKSDLLGDFFSSTTDQVMQHADAPLLVVPKLQRAVSC
jgi:nucleotide-binding universal stress UspA family protein